MQGLVKGGLFPFRSILRITSKTVSHDPDQTGDVIERDRAGVTASAH